MTTVVENQGLWDKQRTNKMNKQELSENAKNKFLTLFNIRKNHLIVIEQELANNPTNADLEAKVVSYRLFITKEEANMDKLFTKMGWVA